MALPDFLIDVPSHFNWGIDIGTAKEFNPLKLQLDEHLAHNPGVMTIQALLFQSFIHVSQYKGLKPDYVRGKEYLNQAYEEIKGVPNKEEKRGYLIVAKCNEAFMDHTMEEQTTSLAEEIQRLLSEKTDLAQACIDSIRAFALSRVGMSKYDEAKIYYQKALDVQPNNTQWLFGLALVTGRRSRNRDGHKYSDKAVERKLYEKILTIDKNHALAHVFLAFNLSFNGDHAAAMRHASKARELAPQHPPLLVKASKVFRKAGYHKDALPILKDACAIGHNSAMFHEMGLAYRDMYNDQNRRKKVAIQKRQRFDQPDKELLRQAILCYTQALEDNATNNMALLDRARTYERLRLIKEAEGDFRNLLAVKNTDFINRVQFNTAYADFLQRTCNNEENACERYRIAIDCAAKNCVTHPVTRENPKPVFDGALKKDLHTAKKGYMNAMEKKAESGDPETHSQGLKGLAWLDQVYGEHDSARAKYEEYLDCDENRNDSDAIQSLVKTLIQLGDFEEARRRIQELKGLQKLDLVNQLTVKCTLVQGEEAQVQGDHKLAKELFKEAIECGSMDGCFKLADILIKYPDISGLKFRIDCAKILHCCEKNDQADIPLYDEIKKLMKLEDATYGKLRNYHLNLELAILGNTGTGVTRLILDKATQTLDEARKMLDRVIISFRETRYPTLQGTQCTFFHVKQDDIKQPKTEQQVKDEIVKRLKKWTQFDTRFPDLLEFLVKLQPAYPGNTDNWYLALSALVNRDKHNKLIRYSHYHIPLNGKKGIITPAIPRGMPVYGDPSTVHQGQYPEVTYELVAVVDIASKAAIEVERIVAEFYKHIRSPKARAVSPMYTLSQSEHGTPHLIDLQSWTCPSEQQAVDREY
ncbi:uncharacterized protein [Amphiura filiformis]|uniref:uncharacterized protein n=1 Tax=Amphiura filiformis TaxID=82378 RepID=UPI003B214014